MAQYRGMVAFFAEGKGYVRLSADDSSQDPRYFAVLQEHCSEPLLGGDSVEFDIAEDARGARAVNVKRAL